MFDSMRFFALAGVLAFSFGAVAASQAAYQDPPGRVARLSHSVGDISYSPAGEDQWFYLVRNRPLIGGDRIWTDRNARAEFQVGSAALRLGPDTSVEILDLDDRIAQIQMTQGTINFRIRRLYSGQIYEVDTPTLAFTIDQAGSYRIDVDPDSGQTTIVVWEGAGQAYGENSYFPLRAGDRVRFYQADLNDHDLYGLPRADAFDRYCLDRDDRLYRSTSLRYLDDDVIGYADLDDYGSWQPVSSYGNVWFPAVDAGWAPYRNGYWIWQEPWGWTWIDDAPWGFAPSHYGRWVYTSRRWGWIPCQRRVRHVYAPALVVFIGGRDWSLSLSQGRSTGIGWFPLGPRDIYVPSYRTSRDYFSRVNVSNTIVNTTIINNVYNNYAAGNINIARTNYANRTVAGAVTAVPSTVFVNSQPVRQAAARMNRNIASNGTASHIVPIAPNVRSVLGPSSAAKARPPREAAERRVFARNTPPPPGLPFALRERQLRQNPGQVPATQATPTARGRNAFENVRVIAEQRNAINARETRPRREARPPAVGAGQSAQAQTSERERQAQIQRQAEQQRQAQLQQQQIQQQRQAEIQQRQAEQRQRAEQERQAAEQQRAERERQAQIQRQAEQQRQVQLQQQQRQAEIQQQQAEQRQRAEQERQAAEQQRAERERQAQMQRQAEQQRQVQLQQQQRQADIQQRQAEQRQRAEQERQVAERQRTERERQAQIQRQAEQQRQAQLQQQQIQQQRQAEIQQRQAEQRQRIEQEQQAAEQQRAERERQIQIQQQRQAQLQQRQALIEQQQMQAERERQAQARQQARPRAEQQQAQCQPSQKDKRGNRTGKKAEACEQQE